MGFDSETSWPAQRRYRRSDGGDGVVVRVDCADNQIIYDYWHANSFMWPSTSDWEERDFFKNTFNKSPHTDTWVPFRVRGGSQEQVERVVAVIPTWSIGTTSGEVPVARPRASDQTRRAVAKKSYSSNEESVITTSIACGARAAAIPRFFK